MGTRPKDSIPKIEPKKRRYSLIAMRNPTLPVRQELNGHPCDAPGSRGKLRRDLLRRAAY